MSQKALKKAPRVIIGLSGGVDSSVAAALLVNEGYDCAGVFYELWSPIPKSGPGWENNCCSLDAYHDAQRVARKLGIPLYRVNLSSEFKKHVVDQFVAEYAAGRTPNPCVVCNTDVRFGLMLDRALREYQADFVATGHYCVRDHADSWKREQLYALSQGQGVPTQHRLLRSLDSQKDQSYFLYRLSQERLARLLFPVGGMTKPEVRALAARWNLPTASKHDSQQICFVPDGGVGEFLRANLGAQAATVRDDHGKIWKSETSAVTVTVGQRRGIGSFGASPHFVVDKDVQTNTITVSANRNDARLQLSKLILERTHWIGPIPHDGDQLEVRCRNTQNPFRVRVQKDEAGWALVPLQKAQVIAAGQSAVVYKGTEVLGGGIVHQALTCATLPRHDLVSTRT
jgi:tRNA-specific 2-thiouridylase